MSKNETTEDVSKSLEGLGREWHDAVERVLTAGTRLRREEAALVNACNALGKRLGPEDQKVDEIICSWASIGFREEKLLLSIYDGDGEYRIGIRGEGSTLRPLDRESNQ